MFIPLASRAEMKKDKIPLREVSDQRRLLNAEDERWAHGSEVRREDFAALLTRIAEHVEDWQKLA
jgi:hypothetical protein